MSTSPQGPNERLYDRLECALDNFIRDHVAWLLTITFGAGFITGSFIAAFIDASSLSPGLITPLALVVLSLPILRIGTRAGQNPLSSWVWTQKRMPV